MRHPQLAWSLGDEDSRPAALAPTFVQISPTVVVREETTREEQVAMTSGLATESLVQRRPTPQRMKPILPGNKSCLLRYTLRPPKPDEVKKEQNSQQSQDHHHHQRLTLTMNSAPIQAPLRTIKPLEHLTPTTLGRESLTFCTLAVIELIIDSNTPTGFPDPSEPE